MNDISNIKIHESDLREAIDWKIKSLQRAINTATDNDIKAIHQRKLQIFQQALLSINILELPLADKKTK